MRASTVALSIVCVLLPGCVGSCVGDPPPDSGGDIEAYVDSWETVVVGPASVLEHLSIGDRSTNDNFANRGDIEVRYVEGVEQVTVEMQRFTVARSPEIAEASFARISAWAYDLSTPAPPSASMNGDLCFAEGNDGCYVRAYYDGQIQPIRDGVNFRVTLPAEWRGTLELTTEDNIASGVETYPDRGDVRVDGARGDVAVDLDSGNVEIRVSAEIAHYAGCTGSEACEAAGFDPSQCECDQPTNITVANAAGQASNVTIDLGDPGRWYTVDLDNRGSFSAHDAFVCTATIDCAPFDACALDPDFADVEHHTRAELNYPGSPAPAGGGIRIAVVSEDCDNILYAVDEWDYQADPLPEERRGDLQLCVGCL